MKRRFSGSAIQKTIALSQAINNFEFEQALVKLNEIAELCQRIGQ
jgi:hypothetical protein